MRLSMSLGTLFVVNVLHRQFAQKLRLPQKSVGFSYDSRIACKNLSFPFGITKNLAEVDPTTRYLPCSLDRAITVRFPHSW